MKQLGIAEAARAARGRLIPYLLAVTALSFFGLGCSSGRPEAAPGPESVATRQERVQGLNEMRDARFRHSATLLADGTVLVAGGASTFDPNKIGLGTDALASAELYLSSYAGFVSVPDMAVARWAHTATLLRDGTVLIAGGFDKDGNALAATELYDPDAQQFKRGPDLAAARGLHTATLLADGRVLIMGGASDDTFGSAVDAGEVYDPVTATLTTLDHQGATVPSAAVLLDDKRVLLIWPSTERQEFFVPAGVGGAPSDAFAGAGPHTVCADVFGRTVPGHDVSALRQSDGRVLESCSAGGGMVVYVPDDPTSTSHPLSQTLFIGSSTDTGWGDPSCLLTVATYQMADQIVTLGGLESGLPVTFVDYQWVPLSRPRAWHTVTALPDGSALAIGGLSLDPTVPCNTSCPLLITPSAERVYVSPWQDSDGTTLPSDPVPADNSSPSTLLNDGSLLILDPSDPTSPRYATLVHYDGAHFARDVIPLSTPRSTQPSLVRLSSGSVLVTGGDTDDTGADEELLAPGAALTAPAGFRLSARGSGISLAGDSALFAGKDKLELVRLTASDTFEVTELSMPPAIGCERPALLRMPSGRVLVAGEDSVFEVDPYSVSSSTPTGSSSFSPAVPLVQPRCSPALVALPNGTAIILGGDGTNMSIEIYDPASTSTQPRTNAPLPGTRMRYWFDQLLMGGANSSDCLFDWPLRKFQPTVGPGPLSNSNGTLLPDGSFLNLAPYDYPSHLTIGPYAGPYSYQFTVDGLPKVHMGEHVALGNPFSTSAPEGSSGTTSASATNAPVAVWFPADSGWPALGTLTHWSERGADWRVPHTPFPGLGLFFYATNGQIHQLGPVEILPSVQGSTCSWGGECESGYCVDGVCCDSTCDGSCLACSKQAGGQVDGQCTQVAAGTKEPLCTAESVKTCGQDGTCNAQGACASYAEGTSCDTGAACSGGRCKDLVPDAAAPDAATPDAAAPDASSPVQTASCDGDHTVTSAQGAQQDCGAYRCSLATAACLTRCSTNRDCSAGTTCGADAACTPPLPELSSRGCGCRTTPSPNRHALLASGLLGAFAFGLRRSRRARRSSRRTRG